jgi:hypothetical protein
MERAQKLDGPQKFAAAVQKSFPGAELSSRELASGVWFLNAAYFGREFVVEHVPAEGFGVSEGGDDILAGIFSGHEFVTKTPATALRRLLFLMDRHVSSLGGQVQASLVKARAAVASMHRLEARHGRHNAMKPSPQKAVKISSWLAAKSAGVPTRGRKTVTKLSRIHAAKSAGVLA